ncbi:MAG: GAF domain-containing protein, partial [Anaerolineales bacterium]
RILKSGMMTAGDYKRFWKRLLNKEVVKGKFINKCMDGRLVTIEGSANPILDDSGEIVGFLAIQRDITQREQAEERNRQRNKELAALNAIATTMSQSLNLNQILNGALEEVLKLDMFESAAKGMIFRLDEEKGELVLIAHRGAPEEHPCLAEAPKVGECLCGLCAQQGKVIISDDCLEDKRHLHRWPEMSEHKDICLPLKVRGEVLGVMNVRLPSTHKVSVHDLELLTSVAEQIGVAIENARLFEAVSQQHERLRTLSLRLAEAEESERRRLTQELHDRVGQKLTALGINLNIIRAEMPNNGPQKLYDCLTESQDLVEQTTRLIRGVMSDLRPPMLDDLGLVETLHWYGEQIASRTGLNIIVKSDQNKLDLPTHIENALFRIAQESLSNVVKHAQAAEVRITVETIDESIRLTVADDGVGCCPDNLADAVGERGWGLLIMAERAEALGGRCWIESHRPEGRTRVIAEVPR